LYALLAAAPVAVAVIWDWNVYTQDVGRCVSLSFGGAIATVLIILQAMGHTPKKVKRVVWYALAAGMLWLLKPLIASLALLVTCMTIGEALAMVIARPLIVAAKRARDNRLLSETLVKTIEEVQGRV
jgi:hypothetical protein